MLLLLSCTESDVERRARLSALADEVPTLSEQKATERMKALSLDDLKHLGVLLQERLTDGTELTQKMIGYAGENSVKADRLVAQCESQLGVSSRGPDARLVGRCVDSKW